MTKEEQWIKESIENFIFAYTGKRAKISDADAQHFTASVMSYLNLLTPSLPSDMDEAAQKVEDYYDVGEEHGYLYCHRGDIKDTFKAGAEWMAGQGETFNGFMSVSGKRSLIAIEGSSQNFKFGEDVIVQIRKKQ